MATIITSDCINCGACEAECPNTAIYQGGVEWELNGVKHPALSTDIFFIVPDKCTECVGFFEHEACAAVCPVDCCIPDPNNPESEDVLLARAKQLHADKTFGDNFPSRFRTAGSVKASAAPAQEDERPAPATAKAPVPAAEAPQAAPPPAPPAAVATPPPATKPAAAPAAPVAAKASPAAASAKPQTAPPAPAGTQAPAVPSSGIPGPEAWDIPIECFRCGRDYTVAFKHFRSGAVLYCPSCHGSYVVTTSLYGAVSREVRRFHTRWREQFVRGQAERPSELEQIEESQRAQLSAFLSSLKAVSRDIRVPGAPRKRTRMFG
jgi:ferredoxin